MAVSGASDDYIVIGSGSTGSSIAYHLAAKRKKVTVVEWKGIAAGNTGKSSALVRTHYSNELIARMALYSLRIFGNFDLIGYSGFTRNGMIFPFGEKYTSIARENARMLRSLGINEEEIGKDKVREYYPDINLDGYEYITYEPESGYADPVATANAFSEKAKDLAARYIVKRKAVKIDTTKSGPKVMLDDGSSLLASKVILATNVWTNDLLEQSGISRNKLLPIHASLHSIIYLRRPEEYRGYMPTLWDPKHLAYYKMEGSTLTAIGSLDPRIDEMPVDIHENLPETATDEYVEKHLWMLTETLPSMDKATLVSTLTGLYDMTPDGQAIIDSLSSVGLDSVYVCAGLSGHGFKLSPAFGRIVSEMVTVVEPEKAIFDWRPFSLNRFKRGNLIRSKYAEIGTIY